MKYTDYRNNPVSFRALTGLSIEQFEELLPYFEEAHDDYLSKYEMNGKLRKNFRRFTVYANSPLPTVAERLFFILVYLKNNPLQEYHAACFDMGQKHCNTFIHGLNHILHLSLCDAGVMPAEIQKELTLTLEQLSKDGIPILLHDGTEREIPRPLDPEEQRENYSGKKKNNTLKNGVISTALCVILFVSQSVPGKMHDKKIADTMYAFPYPCVLYQDTGYQGYNPESSMIMQPIKKPKGRELTEEEKEYNRKISSFRVRIEHVIGSAKYMRIAKDECRLRANEFPHKIFRTCAALHNFRIKINPWHYKN
jgi:hypothetical protein